MLCQTPKFNPAPTSRPGTECFPGVSNLGEAKSFSICQSVDQHDQHEAEQSKGTENKKTRIKFFPKKFDQLGFQKSGNDLPILDHPKGSKNGAVAPKAHSMTDARVGRFGVEPRVALEW